MQSASMMTFKDKLVDNLHDLSTKIFPDDPSKEDNNRRKFAKSELNVGELQSKLTEELEKYTNTKTVICNLDREYEMILDSLNAVYEQYYDPWFVAPISNLSLKDQNNEIQTSSAIVSKMLQTHYTEMFKSKNLSGCSRVNMNSRNNVNDKSETKVFSCYEIMRVMTSMKANGQRGPDGYNIEMLINGGAPVQKVLAYMFNKYMIAGKIPSQWKKSVTSLIAKSDKDKHDLESYRPISMQDTIFKVFCKAILIRIEYVLDRYLTIEQTGCIRGFSSRDHIHAVTQLIEKCRDYELPLVLVFVDFKHAFDSVENNVLLEALRETKTKDIYIRIIMEMQIGTSTVLKMQDGTSVEIPLEKGVRQGNSLSPKLFTIVMQYIMNKIDIEQFGFPIDNKKLSYLSYLDDVVLISDSIESAQLMLEQFTAHCAKYGFIFNSEKTKYMKNQFVDGRISYKTCNIEEVSSFKYLGRLICMDNDLGIELVHRREKAFEQLVTRKFDKTYTSDYIFSSIVLPKLLYCSETWSLDRQSIAIIASYIQEIKSYLGLDPNNEIFKSLLNRRSKWISALHKTDNWAGILTRWTPVGIPRRDNGARWSNKYPLEWFQSINEVYSPSLHLITEPRSTLNVIASELRMWHVLVTLAGLIPIALALLRFYL